MQISDFKTEFQKVISHLRQELGSLRTGRANPAMLDGIKVDAYGEAMDLKGVATVTVPDSRTIQVEPWDKGLLKAIEKAIAVSQIGISPVVDAAVVRCVLPKLTEENRKELVKIMQKKLEEARVAVRQVREKARNGVIAAMQAKKISEDERFKLQEELDKMTRQFTEEIEAIGKEKEKEIMTV